MPDIDFIQQNNQNNYVNDNKNETKDFVEAFKLEFSKDH